jgi:hypothetical protein
LLNGCSLTVDLARPKGEMLFSSLLFCSDMLDNSCLIRASAWKMSRIVEVDVGGSRMTSPLYTLTTVHDVPTSTCELRHPRERFVTIRCMGGADANHVTCELGRRPRNAREGEGERRGRAITACNVRSSFRQPGRPRSERQTSYKAGPGRGLSPKIARSPGEERKRG